MAIDSFTTLKSAVTDWLDTSELDSVIDTLVSLAESRMEREVFIRDRLCRDTIGVASRYVQLPNDFLRGHTLRLLTDPVTALQHISVERMDRHRREVEDRPVYYTVHSEIEFDVEPDQVYTGEIIYYRTLRRLSATNTTSPLLERAPDIYLYATLSAASPFLQDDERIALWETLYSNARDALNREDTRTIGTPISAPSGILP